MLKKKIKNLIKKIIYPNHYSNEAFIKYLKKHKVQIGENTFFYSPRTTTIDVQNGAFISIGSKCKITQGCVILAHDYSYSVCRPIYHDIPKKAGITSIGNNCFIGINSIILMGAEIGNNCIIGAGSVVSGKIPSNQVWAGNPAKYICSIEEYHNKCLKKYEESAVLTINQYKKMYNRHPSIQELQYFSLLFLNNSEDAEKEYQKMSFTGDNKEEVIKDCINYKSKYKSYDEFIKKHNLK